MGDSCSLYYQQLLTKKLAVSAILFPHPSTNVPLTNHAEDGCFLQQYISSFKTNIYLNKGCNLALMRLSIGTFVKYDYALFFLGQLVMSNDLIGDCITDHNLI